MDSQETRSNAAESSSNREPIAVKPNPPLQPVFRARPQGPPGLPRHPVNNGPIGQPRPRGQPPIRFENRSPIGLTNSGQFVQLRPYGPPRPPGSYPQKPSQQGQHPPIVLNPRYPPSLAQRPGPQQGPRSPQSGNFQRFQGSVQRPQQPRPEHQSTQQQGRHPDILARSQEVLLKHFQRNESLLNISQQSLPAKRDDRKPEAPRVTSEKMAHVESAKGVQQLENAVSKEKIEVREIAENDDDDDVVMDGKSPRLNGEARKQEDLIESKLARRESVESTKRPDTAAKRDDLIESKLAKSEAVESIRRPDTGAKRDDLVELKPSRKDSVESIKRPDTGAKQDDTIESKVSRNGSAESTKRPDTATKQDDSIESKVSRNGSAESTKRPDTATKQDDSIESKVSRNGSAESTKRPDTATKQDDSIEQKLSKNGSADSTKRPDTATKQEDSIEQKLSKNGSADSTKRPDIATKQEESIEPKLSKNGSADSTKRPDTATKQDESIEPKLSKKEDTESTKRPETATINGKIDNKPDVTMEKVDSKVSEVASDLDSKKSNDMNVIESDNRLASPKSAEETRKEPLDKQEIIKVSTQLKEPPKQLIKDEIAIQKEDLSKETVKSTVTATIPAIAEDKIKASDSTSVSTLPEQSARPESAKQNGHELDMSSISPVKTAVTIPTTTLSDGSSQQLQIPSKSAGQPLTTTPTVKHPEQSKDESKTESPLKPSSPTEVSSSQKPEPAAKPSGKLEEQPTPKHATKDESEQEPKKPSTPVSKSLEDAPAEAKQTEEKTKQDDEKQDVKSMPISDSKSDVDSSIEAMEGSDKSCVSTPLGTNQSQSQTESPKTSEKSSKEASLDLDGSRDEKESKDLPAKAAETAEEPKTQKISEDSQPDNLARDSLEANKVDLPGREAAEKEASETAKSPVPLESQGKVPETVLSPPEPSDDGVTGFDNGQPRSLKSSSSQSPRSPVSPKSPKSPAEEKKLEEGEDKKTADAKNLTDQEKSDEKTAAISKTLRSTTPKGQRAQTPVKQDEKLGKKSPITPEIQNGGVTNETVQSNAEPTTNGVADLATKKSPSKAIEADKRSTAGSPVKSPSKSVKSLPRTPETPSSTVGQEKKKLPMNKVQVGSAPSPNLKTVRSKIGSLENASYKPGGGKVKIENRKLDFSKAQPKIAAKNEKYTPSGGDKKIAQVKLQWNAKPKVGSLENATYKPGGGDKKIETVKLDFKDKAKPKVGSKDNAKHIPGGGSVKSLATPPKTPQDTNNEIQTQKIDIKAESKIGSLDNVKHKPGGGDKKIFNDKDYLRQTGSNVESLSGSLSGSLSPVPPGTVTAGKNGLPTSDENLNQEC
ncbi:unnamed protein product [Xylocopa violacea]|uniref:Microtubule-associated protein n=1 Tax=Xylocopa violacea TaxID=135666 RepID=A0ABP1N8X7_XYLVO